MIKKGGEQQAISTLWGQVLFGYVTPQKKVKEGKRVKTD